MKRSFKKEQWHIFAIVFALFALSLLSWMSFGSKLFLYLGKNYDDNENTAPTLNNTSFEDKTTGDLQEEEKLEAVFNILDSFIDNFDSKWYKNIFKKSYLSKIDSLFTYYTTGEISSSQVVLGKDNWLFYKSKTDGDPIGDYEGTNRYSQKEINNILQTALSTQSEIENRGIKFVILVAPNKENIYSDLMPDLYMHSDISRTDLLVDRLYDNGVHIISPKTELIDNHLDFQVFYPYDTHWNQLGAYIGVKNTLAIWDISLPELSDRTVSEKSRDAEYDLAGMVGLSSIFNDETEYEVEGTLADWKVFHTEQIGNQISHIVNDRAKNQAKLFLVGDSFRVAMIPALGEIFSDVYVVHRSDYTVDMLDDIAPDYLIAEYVERYSYELGDIDALVK